MTIIQDNQRKNATLTVIPAIESTVQQFIVDWNKSPFLWDTEMDIHVELASRLKTVLREFGLLQQKVSYKGYGHIDVSLLSCGYPVEFDEKKKESSYCRPDIQIWKPAEDSQNPPDRIEGINWPILWICEIKYKTEIGGDQNKKNREGDIGKLKRLAKENGGPAEYCYILHLERSNSGAGTADYRRIQR